MSKLEQLYEHLLAGEWINDYQREYRFAPPRRWRFDFAWPDKKLAVEIEGGVWSKGRHTRGKGFINDCDKYNAAVLLGWRVLRFTDKHLNDGNYIDPCTAVQMTMDALEV